MLSTAAFNALLKTLEEPPNVANFLGFSLGGHPCNVAGVSLSSLPTKLDIFDPTQQFVIPSTEDNSVVPWSNEYLWFQANDGEHQYATPAMLAIQILQWLKSEGQWAILNHNPFLKQFDN